MSEPRPMQHLKWWGQSLPGCWRELSAAADAARASKAMAPWCYLPVPLVNAWWMAKLERLPPRDRPAQMLRTPDVLAQLPALGSWRATKGIYRFDDALLEELLETPTKGKLPVELFEALPEWCCYVELGGRKLMGVEAHGVYIHLDDVSSVPGYAAKELRFIVDHVSDWSTASPKAPHMTGLLIELVEGATVDEACEGWMRKKVAELERASSMFPGRFDVAATLRDYVGVVSRLASLALWLCSQEPEIEGEGTPSRPPLVRKRRKVLHTPVQTVPRGWGVGARIGAKLRDTKARRRGETDTQAGAHASPRPHIRRAHWHTYWTGAGRTNRLLRWVHPILVGASEGIVPTVHVVEDDDGKGS